MLHRITVRLIRTPGLYDGVEYAYAAGAPTASLVFTAGACPRRTVTGGVRAQRPSRRDRPRPARRGGGGGRAGEFGGGVTARPAGLTRGSFLSVRG